MHTQQPSDRTRAAFRRPDSAEGPPSPACPELCRREFWILNSAFPPIMQNEPNSRTPGLPLPPVFAKRTLKETHAKGVPPLYLTPTEVGDIRPRPKTRNEPNLPHSHGPTDPKTRNEPNLSGISPDRSEPNYTKRTQFTVPLASRRHSQPHCAKRTQFPPGMPKAAQPHNIQSTIYNIQSPCPIPGFNEPPKGAEE